MILIESISRSSKTPSRVQFLNPYIFRCQIGDLKIRLKGFLSKIMFLLLSFHFYQSFQALVLMPPMDALIKPKNALSTLLSKKLFNSTLQPVKLCREVILLQNYGLSNVLISSIQLCPYLLFEDSGWNKGPHEL